MNPIQEQEQEQQQQQNLAGCAPPPHFGIRLEMSARPAASTITQAGKLPKLTTTLRAEVLATLLAGDDMAGTESVFANGSTKLATVMRALTRRYRWPIERREFATNMADGQVAWVSMYTLPAEVIASAFDLGAEAWLAEVRTARSKRHAAQHDAQQCHCLHRTRTNRLKQPESRTR